MTDYVDFNSQMWDKWSEGGNTWTIPVTHEDFVRSQNGELIIYLTPQKPVPSEWYRGLGKKVLGLASGGGQQGALLTASGYDVTIFDNSRRQLAAERSVAEREGYWIDLVKGDMTRHFPFEDESFDWIINPVSNCYIEDLTTMWSESFRVLRKGGALMTGFTNPMVYMFADEDMDLSARTPLACKFPLPYNGRHLEAAGKNINMDEGYQFSHTLESQLGGQTRVGFQIKALYEDTDDSCRLSKYSSLYIADLAVKP
ncbi:MAG: class I SAM-dependent methyltransferase [Chloroflexi bacterium]|nr:class I SAM-dependent methyltransferase [Chloroflexota bacterium]